MCFYAVLVLVKKLSDYGSYFTKFTKYFGKVSRVTQIEKVQVFTKKINLTWHKDIIVTEARVLNNYILEE